MIRPDPTPEIEALLADAAAGELSPVDAAELERLLADDPGLAELLDEQMAVRSLLALESAPLGDLGKRRLRAAVTGALAPTPRRWVLPTVAAAFVIVVGVGALLSSGTPFGGGGSDATPPGLAATSFRAEYDDTGGVADGTDETSTEADTAAGAMPTTTAAAGEDTSDGGYVQASQVVTAVEDPEDVRDLAPLPGIAVASEVGFACFSDDNRLVVIAARVITPDDVIHEVVVTTDDELVARTPGEC